MLWLKVSLFLLFFPASLGLLWQSLILNNLSEQLISFAFFLFSLEQGRMAFIDITSYFTGKTQNLLLDNITIYSQEMKQESQTLNFPSPQKFYEDKNNNLSQFLFVVILTIIIELFGFYFALFFLGWGAIFVLISQVFFNIFAPLKVLEAKKISLTNYNFSDKATILLADTICLILMSLWVVNFYSLTISVIILLITLTFAGVKYGMSV